MGAEKAEEAKFKIYDSHTGEFLGRTIGSWLKIIIFYIIYFSFLAGLFLLSLTVIGSMTGNEKPNLKTRLQIPGMNVFPAFNGKNKEHVKRLKENDNVDFVWDSTKSGDADPMNYKFYTDIIGTLEFPTGNGETLGDCQQAPYGWDTTSPCLFLRLNKVIDWTPVGFFSPEEAKSTNKDIDTFFHLPGNGLTVAMKQNGVYMRCAELTDEPTLTFTYFGGASTEHSDGYVDSSNFPYEGNKINGLMGKDYKSPVVAVKVNGLEEGKIHRVRCHAYAKNIVIHDGDKLGSATFEMQHGALVET